MKTPGRTSWILSQITAAACAIGTGLEYIHWKHRVRADGPVQTKMLLGMCILFSLVLVARFFRRGLVTGRDYFAEEMDHRRSLAKGPR